MNWKQTVIPTQLHIVVASKCNMKGIPNVSTGHQLNKEKEVAKDKYIHWLPNTRKLPDWIFRVLKVQKSGRYGNRPMEFRTQCKDHRVSYQGSSARSLSVVVAAKWTSMLERDMVGPPCMWRTESTVEPLIWFCSLGDQPALDIRLILLAVYYLRERSNSPLLGLIDILVLALPSYLTWQQSFVKL